MLAALAAVTERIGLTGTINSTFNEPYEVARQFATVDHLSGGRAAWNVVTSWDAFTGENFRRGGFLPQDQRYGRARTFLATALELWDSWRGDEIVADKDAGEFLATPEPGGFEHHDSHFDIRGHFNVPRSPQGRPVIFQAGIRGRPGIRGVLGGRDLLPLLALRGGEAFYADVKRHLAGYGRTPDDLLIMPSASFVLADTDTEARELAREVRRKQVSPQTAIKFLEQLWNTDLSDHDPDGPLPDFDPLVGEELHSKGRASVRMYRDPVAIARQWRAQAEAEHLTSRELIIKMTGRQEFIGSAATIAETINRYVQNDAADGYIIGSHLTPGGLDPFVAQMVPLLQERGVFRTEYAGPTLRDQLGLRPAAGVNRSVPARYRGRAAR